MKTLIALGAILLPALARAADAPAPCPPGYVCLTHEEVVQLQSAAFAGGQGQQIVNEAAQKAKPVLDKIEAAFKPQAPTTP